MGQTCQVNAYGVLLNSYRRTLAQYPNYARQFSQGFFMFGVGEL